MTEAASQDRPPEDPAGITVRGLSRRFGSVHAVVDANLVVPPGSVTALIGPNGSGKTTLLLMLATLLAPDAGRITIAGHDPVTDPAAVRLRMGWMPDVLGSWPSLSPRAALTVTGQMYRMDRSQAARRAEELIRLTDLGDLADRPARVLSRGQKQRLSLARALVHNPRVLLLDEPASGLDPAARRDLQALLRRLAGEGAAVLISSHVLAELDEMADAAVYLAAGRTASADAIASSSARERAWRIRALNPAVLARELAGTDAAVSVDTFGSLVQVGSQEAAAALLARLVDAGVQVTEFGPAVGDLEHTFLELNRPEASA